MSAERKLTINTRMVDRTDARPALLFLELDKLPHRSD